MYASRRELQRSYRGLDAFLRQVLTASLIVRVISQSVDFMDFMKGAGVWQKKIC
jgi:hypothetical protein